MNPNAAQSLDPKLKETYDRIMGTPTSVPSNPPQTANQPQPQTAQAPVQQTHVPVEGLPTMTAQPDPQSPTPVKQTNSVDASTSVPEMVTVNATASIAKPAANPRKISPIILIVAGVGFFLIYTVVWLKVFKIF